MLIGSAENLYDSAPFRYPLRNEIYVYLRLEVSVHVIFS